MARTKKVRTARITTAGAAAAPPGEATRAKLREIVSAIAADVIAETAERMSKAPRRDAAALRMARGTRSGPTLPRRG
ncbi:hypothetical protein [Elioraea sp.]|uniref:hypothetical protein n=1 Tax=Elioraea sp. TaxID=2185103 RepID=UPI0025B8C0FA|nr:hypothetical protein [Elioraea sp.]